MHPHLPLNTALRAAGKGVPAASPYAVEVRGFPSVPRTLVLPHSDSDGVGARHRHALPGRRFSPFNKNLPANFFHPAVDR